MKNIFEEVQTAFHRPQKISLFKRRSLSSSQPTEAGLITKLKDSLDKGDGVRKSLENYIKQVLNLLAIISASRNADWNYIHHLWKKCEFVSMHIANKF